MLSAGCPEAVGEAAHGSGLCQLHPLLGALLIGTLVGKLPEQC